MQALYHGVVQLVIPLFFEQPWNAEQVEFLGAGLLVRCLYPIQSGDLAAKLTAAIHEAAASTTMHAAAQRISHLMQADRWTAAERAASKSPACPILTPRKDQQTLSIYEIKCVLLHIACGFPFPFREWYAAAGRGVIVTLISMY